VPSCSNAPVIEHEPDEAWDFYLTTIHDHPASIAVDLGLEAHAPMIERPWLSWLKIPMSAPRIDGLATPEEAPALAALEEALAEGLRSAIGARQAGRLTTRGRRELFFYAESTVELEGALADVGRAHAAYAIEHVTRRDETWALYRELLVPGDEERRWMAERNAADAAAERGGPHRGADS